MVSKYIGEFVVLIVSASFHKLSEGELMPVFYLKKIDAFLIILDCSFC